MSKNRIKFAQNLHKLTLTSTEIMKLLKVSTILGASLFAISAFAETEPPHGPKDHGKALNGEILRMDVEARIDWEGVRTDGNTDDANSGFKGKYLLLRVDGEIMSGLTYSWRQRFSRHATGFDSTDWVWLNYATDGWNFQAGKEVVAIGGYEYDRAPIDLYGTSVFWNNIPCFKLGVLVGRQLGQNDKLSFQVSQSPFVTSDNNNLYGYNLLWNGSHGIFESIWSVNMMEYEKGKFINYISLGNKFTVDKVWLELDFMNRATRHQKFLFKDCSLVAELSYKPTDRWRLYGKYTYDVNKTDSHADYTVFAGTHLNMAGGGLEFMPLAKDRQRLRLHAGAFYSWGENANSADYMQNKTLYFTAGLTWNMNLLNVKRKH